MRSFGSESEGVSLRKEVPLFGVHVSKDLVDQLHSLRSVVEDASMISRVVEVIRHLEGFVVLVELAHANFFFRFYAFVF